MSAALSLAGAVCVAAAGLGTGVSLARRKGRRQAALEQLSCLFAVVKSEILYRAAPLGEVLAQLQSRQDLPLLFLGDCRALGALACPPDLTAEDWQQLQGFFEQLGSACSQEEARRCDYYGRICAGLAAAAKRDYEQARQLYAKLGLCCGLLAALLLL